MIKICRIDHRLLHGQVAFVWCRSLNADAILIVSDAVAKDEMRMATMRLAKPAGVKLVIKSVEDSIKVINSGVTDKYKLMVVVENVQDAYDLVKACERMEEARLKKTEESWIRRSMWTTMTADCWESF
jgi:fructoselysine and glucoselysine-specific PTS system IIB component